MKKRIFLAIAFIFIMLVSAYAVETSEMIELKMTVGSTQAFLNGEAQTLDAAPMIRESRTMLPVRFVAESLGAAVAWDGGTSTAVITSPDTEIKITIGMSMAHVNGEEKLLDAPAFIENSRTYLPVRFVAESLGAVVAWDGETSTAVITKTVKAPIPVPEVGVYYETDFSDKSVLEDFTAYRGEWVVRNGRLYLDSLAADLTSDASAFLLFNRPDAANLTNYMIDVDMYNIQTQGGVLMRCDYEKASDESSNSFYGYMYFVGSAGDRGAIGYSSKLGTWGGNLVSSSVVFEPGMDLHLNFIVYGDRCYCTYTDLDTGKVVLSLTKSDATWSSGTFGFRLAGEKNGLDNLGRVYFDNLKVTVIDELALPTNREPVPHVDNGVTDVLFIGNSYTYVNDIPAKVKNICAGQDVKINIHTELIGGGSLRQHYDNFQNNIRRLEEKIELADIVIFQDYAGIIENSYEYCMLLMSFFDSEAVEFYYYPYITKPSPYYTYDGFMDLNLDIEIIRSADLYKDVLLNYQLPFIEDEHQNPLLAFLIADLIAAQVLDIDPAEVDWKIIDGWLSGMSKTEKAAFRAAVDEKIEAYKTEPFPHS